MPDFLLEHLENKTTKRLTIDGDRILIGRNPAAEIALADSGVSKNHVLIERQGDSYTFRDLGSSNGTRHNDDDRSSGTLRHRDQLLIGRVRITVLLDESAQAMSAEAIEPVEAPPSPEPTPSLPAASVPDPAPPEVSPATDDTAPSPTRRRNALVLSIFAGMFLVGIGAGTAIGLFMRGMQDDDPTTDSTTAPSPTHSNAAVQARPADTGTPTAATPNADSDATTIAHSHALYVLNRELPALARNDDARYSDYEESERALFRMYFDILRRPPTRHEAERYLVLGHLDRWTMITAQQSTREAESLSAKAAFQTFLGRAPSELEKLELRKWPAADLPLLGALLTSTREYRAASHRRQKDAEQLARSLYVDLCDDSNPAAEDLRRVETILADLAPSTARSSVVRLLASSSVLRDPRREHDTTTESLVRWIQSETRRFLQHAATSDELKAILKRMKAPGVDLRWYRMALASSKAYGSY